MVCRLIPDVNGLPLTLSTMSHVKFELEDRKVECNTSDKFAIHQQI